MKHIIILALVVGSFTTSIAQENLFLENKITKLQNQKNYILECINMLDEKDLDFKPTDDEINTRLLLLHMASNMMWITKDYLGGNVSLSKIEDIELTKSQLTQHITDVFDAALTTLDNYSPHLLKTRADFFAGEKNMMQMIELMDDHFTHHKGQLNVYMRLCGKKPPRYVGW